MGTHSFSGFSKPVQQNAMFLHDNFVQNTEFFVDIEQLIETANIGLSACRVLTQDRDLDLLTLKWSTVGSNNE